MAELNQDKNTFRSHKNSIWEFGLLLVNFPSPVKGKLEVLNSGASFYDLLFFTIPVDTGCFIYSDDIKEHQKPEITVFLAEKVSPDKAALLAKMAAAVSVTNQITIIEPKTAAKKVAKTLNLSADLQEAIKFPRTIQIIFPNDADPLVLEELAQLLPQTAE